MRAATGVTVIPLRGPLRQTCDSHASATDDCLVNLQCGLTVLRGRTRTPAPDQRHIPVLDEGFVLMRLGNFADASHSNLVKRHTPRHSPSCDVGFIGLLAGMVKWSALGGGQLRSRHISCVRPLGNESPSEHMIQKQPRLLSTMLLELNAWPREGRHH